MKQDLKNEEAIKKLQKLAQEVRICMFANTDTESNDYGRPMSTAKVDDDGSIWFFTKEDQPTAEKTKKDSAVCLYYSHPGTNTYLTVKGSAAMVKDKEKMKELYNPMLKAWFPKGLDEPGITLLKVTPQQAHYWDVDAAKLVVLFAMAKGAVTGEVKDMGKHGSLDIKN